MPAELLKAFKVFSGTPMLPKNMYKYINHQHYGKNINFIQDFNNIGDILRGIRQNILSQAGQLSGRVLAS